MDTYYLVSIFGAPIVAYALNIDEVTASKLGQTLATPDWLTPEQLESVNLLTQARVNSAFQGLPTSFAISDSYEQDQHLLNTCRKLCGGNPPTFDFEDPLLKPLEQYLPEVYPNLLLLRARERADDPVLLSSIQGPYNHPAGNEFGRRFCADPVLGSIFDHPIEGDQSSAYSKRFFSSSGGGGNTQVALIPKMVSASAVQLMLMRDEMSPLALQKAIIDSISMMRLALAGEPLEVPTLIGFRGVSLESGVKLPWGTLTPRAETDHPSTIIASLNGQGTSFTLESSIPYFLAVGEEYAAMDSHARNKLAEGQLQLRRLSHMTCLSVALVPTGAENRPAATFAWMQAYDPFSFGPTLSWNPIKLVNNVQQHLDDDDLLDLQKIARCIHERSVPDTDVAERRIISAISNREDPIDGFIDAVVAWESIFSVGARSELGFRISSAMAKLTQSDPGKLLEQQRIINKLYDQRSKMVHGGRGVNHESAVRWRNQAVDIFLHCLRRLYEDYPHLLADEDRSRKIILTH